MSFLGTGVCAGMVASFSLLKAWTTRHPPVALRTQKVGLLCGDLLSRTCPDFCLPAKNLSIASTCSLGNGHCRVTQYLVPGKIHVEPLGPAAVVPGSRLERRPQTLLRVSTLGCSLERPKIELHIAQHAFERLVRLERQCLLDTSSVSLAAGSVSSATKMQI